MRRWLIALLVALFGGLSLIYSASQVNRYGATATVQVSPAPASQELAAALDEFGPNSDFVATQAGIIASRTLAERVVEEESLSIPPLELADSINARVVKGTRLIKVTITDPDAAFATRLVTAVVTKYVAGGLPGTAEVHAEIIESALATPDPVSPMPLRDGLLGAGVGLVLGLLLSLIRPRPQEGLDASDLVEAQVWLPPSGESYEASAESEVADDAAEQLWVAEDVDGPGSSYSDEDVEAAEEEELDGDADVVDEEWSDEAPEVQAAMIPEIELEPEGGSFSEFWDRTKRKRRKDRG